MLSKDIRASFLQYFQGLGHRVVPSSSLVPAGDPTLFFANAGMNQFKDVFTGQSRRDYVRAATSQKCLRVSGKHNDFETVGRSLRHHTFFEMLGNFSFGDYFKREAIAWAWRLLTEKWEVPAEHLVATVFEEDDEAEAIWRTDIGLPASRVLRLGAAHNYWSMGETGPNGPCSELHHDFGPSVGCRRQDCSPACDCDRFLEIWNLVFMQFDRDADGRLTRLPRPSIDTGMGLERISAILQGVFSNYDTDLFRPLIEVVSARSGVGYRPVVAGREAEAGTDEEQVSLRVVADHVRAIAFLLGDGVVPSNEGRGYVLRKLLRRAAGHASRLGLAAPILSELTSAVVQIMGDVYPDLRKQAEAIRAACEREEVLFKTTLEQGSAQFGELERRLASGGGKVVPGEDAFRLHDTFGFPIEFTTEMARRSGLTVDRAGFEAALDEQRQRARQAAKSTATPPAIPTDVQAPVTEFRGYTETSTLDTEVLLLLEGASVVPELRAGASGWVLLDRTPFYAESGGQVGDAGWLTQPGSATRVVVEDTHHLRPGVIGHAVRVEAGVVRPGMRLRADVDAPRRRRVMANHTATHLLHAALKEVLGDQARQAGSLVAPDRLRFDFTHHQPLTKAELERVEALVNERVFAQREVRKQTLPYAEAMERGAVAMFGEKYGDSVRVVSVDDWSMELCGGTHCDRTEQIGAFRIVSEKGIASGVRRIEAVTGPAVHERLVHDEDLLSEVERILKAPRAELAAAAERLAGEVRTLRRELDEARRQAAEGTAAAAGMRQRLGGFELEARRLQGFDVTALREMADATRKRAGVDALLLASDKDGKAALVLSLGSELAARFPGEPARELVVGLGREIGGGGGGRAEIAWAGGKQVDKLDAALQRFPALLGEMLGIEAKGWG